MLTSMSSCNIFSKSRGLSFTFPVQRSYGANNMLEKTCSGVGIAKQEFSEFIRAGMGTPTSTSFLPSGLLTQINELKNAETTFTFLY